MVPGLDRPARRHAGGSSDRFRADRLGRWVFRWGYVASESGTGYREVAVRGGGDDDSLRPFVWKQARHGATVCGGLDTALWDLQGKALGLPVSRLFGKIWRDRVEPDRTAMY